MIMYFKFSMDYLMPGFVSPLNEPWNYKEQGIRKLCVLWNCVYFYCIV